MMATEVPTAAAVMELEQFDPSSIDLDELELPPGDDMGIPSDDDLDSQVEEVESESGFECFILVDNIPVVPKEKFEKLSTVLSKLFSQIGTIREGGLIMPFDEAENKSQGFALIEFSTPQEAAAAVEQTHGYKLDKNHVFTVNTIAQYDKYMQVPEEYEPMPTKEYNPIENMHSWLVDERGRDQFAIRYLDWTEVFWNDPKKSQADQVYQRKFWTESFIEWSPRGYYLTTVHRPGAAIWGGPEFTRLNRYAHPGVQLLDFSPHEKYLVTFSSRKPNNPRESQTVTIKVWDVRSGRTAPLRTFEGPAQDYYDVSSGGDIQWPIFKWAGGEDDQYFAKMSKNSISVYEAPGMGLLDKKSIKLEGVEHFSWSPTAPLMAVYIPEQQRGNQPARVGLIEIPSKREIRQKQLFSVHELKLYWHPGGDYLAAVVSRFTKTKKSTYSGFELFRCKERDIAIEVMELDNKADKVVDFAWEPKGHNFIVIHGDGARPDTSLYTMKDSSVKGGLGNVKKRGSFKGKSANQIFWSPQGKFCVLAGMKGLNGQLEFFNAEDMETMATAEHFMCTEVAWDPTGRFVATSVTAVHQMENGFNIWSFNGKLIYRLPRERFFQFLWRPRPPSLLSAEKEAEIQKNLKKYSKKYEEEDELVAKGQDEEVMKERMRTLEEWMEWHMAAAEEIEGLRAEKYAIRGYESDQDVWAVEEEVEEEEVLNHHEEIVETF